MCDCFKIITNKDYFVYMKQEQCICVRWATLVHFTCMIKVRHIWVKDKRTQIYEIKRDQLRKSQRNHEAKSTKQSKATNILYILVPTSSVYIKRARFLFILDWWFFPDLAVPFTWEWVDSGFEVRQVYIKSTESPKYNNFETSTYLLFMSAQSRIRGAQKASKLKLSTCNRFCLHLLNGPQNTLC